MASMMMTTAADAPLLQRCSNHDATTE